MDEYDDFRLTPEFLEEYESLEEREALVVDEAILRLLIEHRGSWARQGRVVGERDEAWKISIRAPDADLALYWQYGEGYILLYLLIVYPH